MNNFDCIIIGGGAAGIFAAAKAAENNKKVLIIEKNQELGRKLKITGKGRCNLSNSASLNEFINAFNKGGKFLRQSFNNYFTPNLTETMKQIGINTVIERGGRIFPVNTNGIGVVKALTKWLITLKISVAYERKIKQISKTENGYTVVLQSDESFFTPKLVIATGGLSYPKTGSTGYGYQIAKQFGHTINKLKPALVPLEINSKLLSDLEELELRNVKAKLLIDGKKVKQSMGEVHFKKWGFTGPLILTFSSKIVNAIDEQKKCIVSIDLKPALDENKLKNRLIKEFSSNQKLGLVLKNLLPTSLVKVCLYQNGFNYSKIVNQVSKQQRNKLINWLKNFEIEIINYKSIEEAIITSGGISLKEINPNTMESKLAKGLYFCGEILDIDAETGGYNLMAAFSTGCLCGSNI